MKKRVLKKSVKRTLIIFPIIVIAIIILVLSIKHITSNEYKLKKLGYNKNEIKEIININRANDALKIGYQDKIIDIYKAKYYIEKNLDKYIEYYNNHKNLPIDKIIAIINVGINNKFYTNVKDADTSLKEAMLVNKYYSLGEYKPEGLYKVRNWYSYGSQTLDEDAYDAFIEMYKAAQADGYKLIINTAYRSYEDQVKTYDKLGDDVAAKPGYSEHQTGYAIDITYPNYKDEEESEEYKWLENNAYKYGYILRYPKDKEDITGYAYEPWHYRYLGKDLALKVYKSGLTYEEYYAYYIENK